MVAPAAPFADRLATRQSPDLALAPLGHEVSPLASPGVLIGLVTTTDAANTGRVDLPVQRHAAEGPGTEVEAPGWSQFGAAEDEITVDRGGAGIGPGVPAAAEAAAAGSSGAAAPATTLAAVQRLASPAAILTASSSAIVAPPPAGFFDLRPRPADASRPPVPPPTAGAQRALAGPIPVTPPVTEAAQPVRRPTLGQARRLGLGAPLPIGPDGSVQRLAANGPAGLGATPGSATPAVVPGAAVGLGVERAVGLDREPLGGEGVAPGDLTVELGAASAGPAQLTVVRPLSIQRLASSPAPAFPERVERTGSDPDGPPASVVTRGLVVQRLPAGAVDPSVDNRPATDGAPEQAADPGLASVGTVSSLAEPVGRTPIRASTAGSLLDPPPPAARAGAAAVARGPGGAGQPVVARSLADPLRSSPAVAPLGTPLADRWTSVLREPVGPVFPRSPAGSARSADQPESPGTPGSPAGAPSVQRAVEVRELVITTQVDNRGPAGEPAGGAAPGSATIPASAGTPPSIADRDRELDELARRLYGRIRTKLAAELLADRERAGLLVDLR